MKILLSAYACEPNRGSEPGVGWHWALELVRSGHEVWVLTRSNNKATIEATLQSMIPMPNLHFLYYDLPRWARWWKKGGRGVHLYYLLWQLGAYPVAKRVHEREKFDLAHHITFGVVRHPSFMGLLGIPFVFGPVGGGERTPWKLRRGYGSRGQILDVLRDVLNLAIRIDPMMWLTFSTAVLVMAKTDDTARVIPKCFLRKTKIRLEIGIDLPDVGDRHPSAFDNKMIPIRMIYVGRFLYLKGMNLGLPAFAEVLRGYSGAQLTLVGQGPDEKAWRALAHRLGIDDNVDWVPWVGKGQLRDLYQQHDVLLFPSLHDSSGNVVLEAISYGLPVVCLDLGGPSAIIDHTCGRVVQTGGKRSGEVIVAMAQAIKELAADRELRQRLSDGAFLRAQAFRWDRVVRETYADIQEAMGVRAHRAVTTLSD